MDIISGFEPDVPGSSPGRSTKWKRPERALFHFVLLNTLWGAYVQDSKTLRAWIASGRSNPSARCTEPVRFEKRTRGPGIKSKPSCYTYSIMRLDKEKAISLRKEGKSYAEISAVLGIPKATLSKWFSKESWSKGVRQSLIRDGKLAVASRIQSLNRVRDQRLSESYEMAKKEAKEELPKLMYDPLFVAGLVLYWSGGDRTSKHQVRFSSADMDKIKTFIFFLEKTCGAGRGRLRASLMTYPGQDEPSNRRFWAFALGPGLKFTKSSVVPGSYDARKLQYGICVVTVSSAYLKVKMLEWLTLLPKRLIDGR